MLLLDLALWLSLSCLCIRVAVCSVLTRAASGWVPLVSFPRASLIPGNLAGWFLCPCPHFLPCFQFHLVVFQNHLHSSPVCIFPLTFPIPAYNSTENRDKYLLKRNQSSPGHPTPSLPFSLISSYTHKHTEWMADFAPLSDSILLPPNIKSRSLPKPKPKPKSKHTEKERITFLLEMNAPFWGST